MKRKHTSPAPKPTLDAATKALGLPQQKTDFTAEGAPPPGLVSGTATANEAPPPEHSKATLPKPR